GVENARAALAELASQIDKARFYRPGALGNALPLPAAMGQALGKKEQDDLDRDFGAFWRNEQAPAENVKALARHDDPGIQALQRVQVTQKLLEKARESEKALERACKALVVLAEM